jgi:putative hemolysin
VDSSVSYSLLAAASASALAGSMVAAGDAAMSALPPGRLAALHEQLQGPPKGHLSRYLANPARVLGRWLVARIVTTSVTAILVSELVIEFAGNLRPLVAVLGTILLLATMSEVATAIARARAAQVGPKLLGLLRPLELMVVPVADPLSWLGHVISDQLRDANADAEPRLTESEVEYLVEDAAKAGEIDAEPAKMIRNVLDFKDLTVRDVMVPRIKISAIEIDTPLDLVLEAVTREGHSRFPIYAERIDNVVGLLYTKDIFPLLHGGTLGTAKLRDIVRTPVNFEPETQPVSTVLRDMRARRQHMAVLVDEFGGVSGIVTLEDLLEQIVGEIRDEYDREEAPIQDLGEGRLLADASVSLADLSAYLGTEIEGDGDYGSLGGMLTHEAGRVPLVDDRIVASGIEFIVRDRDAKRIIRVEIVLPPPSSGSATSPPPPSSSLASARPASP